VRVEVTDSAAVTHVDQVFRNNSGVQLEATFLFPLPADSSVSDFALHINGVRTVGEVLDSTQARQIYNNIVRQIQDPGLVEYVDGRLFQASIFPVPANGTQRVELSFAQVLERDGDLQRLTYPLRTGRTSGQTMADFTLTVEVESDDAIRSLYSPTHEVEVVRRDEHHATVGLEQQAADLEQDFVLYISASDQDLEVDLMSYDPDGSGGDDGYFVMVVAPRLQSEGPIPVKDVTFVVDTSGSMSGEKIEQARDTLRYCVSQLGAEDRFNILRFSTTTRSLFDGLTPVSDASRTRANSFISDFRAAGGTAIEEALRMALAQETSSDRPHMIIFITDGLPTIGETDSQTLVSQFSAGENANARIFSFGVGYDVDTTLLDAMASGHRGVSDYVRPDEDIEAAVSTLYDRIAHPVLTDVAVNWGGADVHDIFPRQLPDLFAGQQVVVTGRFRDDGRRGVSMSGHFAGESMSYGFDERFEAGASRHDYVPQLWATRKIGYLVDQIRLNGETRELRDEVANLGITYGLVTPYTSYLAVDDSEFPVFPRADLGGDWDRRRSGWGATRGGGWEGDADETATAVPMAEDGNFALGNSGRAAVEASEEARRMREQQWSDNRANVRHMGGRQMNLGRDGVWRDNRSLANASAERLNVRYMSDAYFRLLELRPEVARMVSVGDRVEFEVNSALVVQIDASSGVEALDFAMERAIMAD